MSVASDLQTAIAGWASTLAADSASPQPSYSISDVAGGSKSVSRTEWRTALLQNIKEAQEILGLVDPTYLVTKHVLAAR